MIVALLVACMVAEMFQIFTLSGNLNMCNHFSSGETEEQPTARKQVCKAGWGKTAPRGQLLPPSWLQIGN